MKKTLVLILILSVGIARSQKLSADKVPAAVKESFAKMFPGVASPKWEMEKKATYEAGFKLNGKEMSANFSEKGEWLETETEIKSSELPKAALDFVSEHHKGAKIKETAMLKKPNNITQYEVEIEGKDLIFDESGKPVH